MINKKQRASDKAAAATTDIVCKHFLSSVEARKYGWFWACPGGEDCKYKHKLPKVRRCYVKPSNPC